MPRGKPKLRHHATGQGAVRLNGIDVYLGKWPAGQKKPPAAVQQAYDRTIAEWIANGRRLPARHDLTITELIQRYRPHAEARYRKPDGNEPTSEMSLVKVALHHLRKGYGKTLAKEFSASSLKGYRELLLAVRFDKGKRKGQRLARRTVNAYVWRVKILFRWAAENEVFPEAATVFNAIRLVRALEAGRTDAPDYEPRQPPAPASVLAVLQVINPTAAAMIRVQMLTGMRPGELCAMTAGDIDQSVKPWEYRPAHHKTRWRGKKKIILFGPQARALLTPILKKKKPTDPVFILASMGTAYPVDRYREQVETACVKAGVPHWSPHQLRHHVGTMVEAAHGLEAAAHVLGDTVNVAKVYAHAGLETARRVIEELG